MAATATTAAFDAQARTSWPLPSVSTTAHSARRRQGPGEEYETQCTAKFRKHSSPRARQHFTLDDDDDDSVPELGGFRPAASTRSGRRSGFCGTSWSRLETSLLGCLLLTPLCRRWWTSWRMCCRSSISLSLRRRSKCPRSPAFPVLLFVVSSCAADGGTVGGCAIAGVDAACARLRCLWQGVDLHVDAVHGALLDPGGHQAHPEDPPDRVHRQPRRFLNSGQG